MIFRQAFGERVAIQHSGLSDGERHDQWHRIRRGDVDVVVGTRSAVFAPLRAIGLVVVDEEHDGSYKQEETPRYNGRDVAVMRARQAGALVVLGSATPSMESYQNAAEGPLHARHAQSARARSAARRRPHRRHARGVCRGRARRRPERDAVGGDGNDAVAGRAGDRAAESPGICQLGLLPAMRRDARLPELQPVADRPPRGASRALPLLQLFDRAAEGVRQLRREVHRARRVLAPSASRPRSGSGSPTRASRASTATRFAGAARLPRSSPGSPRASSTSSSARR